MMTGRLWPGIGAVRITPGRHARPYVIAGPDTITLFHTILSHTMMEIRVSGHRAIAHRRNGWPVTVRARRNLKPVTHRRRGIIPITLLRQPALPTAAIFRPGNIGAESRHRRHPHLVTRRLVTVRPETGHVGAGHVVEGGRHIGPQRRRGRNVRLPVVMAPGPVGKNRRRYSITRFRRLASGQCRALSAAIGWTGSLSGLRLRFGSRRKARYQAQAGYR